MHDQCMMYDASHALERSQTASAQFVILTTTTTRARLRFCQVFSSVSRGSHQHRSTTVDGARPQARPLIYLYCGLFLTMATTAPDYRAFSLEGIEAFGLPSDVRQ